jgi:quinol monooxygenase YgiN
VVKCDEVTIIAQATALPGREAELRRTLREFTPLCIAMEGVVAFVFYENLVRPGQVVLCAAFTDRASLETFLGSPLFERLTNSVSPLVGGGEPNILRLMPIV